MKRIITIELDALDSVAAEEETDALWDYLVERGVDFHLRTEDEVPGPPLGLAQHTPETLAVFAGTTQEDER